MKRNMISSMLIDRVHFPLLHPMKQISQCFLLCLLFLVGCKSNKGNNHKPNWVQQRPTDEMYYVGIGIASKIANPTNFQQVAKKNAVNDLISEISVTVSSNSLLSQYQRDKDFTQQFESEVKITTLNSIEGFNIVDSWEDKEYFWIYYRLSKEQYKSIKQQKMLAAIDQSLDFFELADLCSDQEIIKSIRLKIKALVCLQPYLNEDIQTQYKGRQIYVVNELVNSIQFQLNQIELRTDTTLMTFKVGQSNSNSLKVSTSTRNNNVPIPFVPINMICEMGSFVGTHSTESNQNGTAVLSIIRLESKASLQFLKIQLNMKAIFASDSIQVTLQNILLSLAMPNSSIRVSNIPISLYIQSNEFNLGKRLQTSYFESSLKTELSQSGCVFIENPETADYVVYINSETKAQGNIWGNMKMVTLNMTISITRQPDKLEIFKEAMRDIKGFQLTEENAGLDAYKTANENLLKNIYPPMKYAILGYK